MVRQLRKLIYNQEKRTIHSLFLCLIAVYGCGGGGGENTSNATLTALSITPTNLSIAKDTTQQFTATGTYSDNTTKDLTTSVNWSSSDPSVATISNAGLATTGGTGGTTILIKDPSTAVSSSTNLTVTTDTTVKPGWELIYANPDSETASSVLEMTDGNILVIGAINYLHDAKYSDIYALKVDSKGNVLWNKQYGGTDIEGGISAMQTADGNYAIIGSVQHPTGSDTGVYLLKIDEGGIILSEKTIFTDGYKTLSECRQTADGGYIIVGSKVFNAGTINANTDLYFIKINNNGNIEWEKTIGSNYKNELGLSIALTTDSGFIITGANQDGLYIVKTDSNGAVQWEKTIYTGGYGRSIQQIPDGGYIIAGTANTKDVYLLKIDTLGNVLWEKTYGGTNEDSGYSVQQTTDGGYMIVGSKGFYYEHSLYGDFYGGPDLYLIKTDGDGNLSWEKTYGSRSAGYCVRQVTNGYIIAGSIYSDANSHDFYILKTDNTGNID